VILANALFACSKDNGTGPDNKVRYYIDPIYDITLTEGGELSFNINSNIFELDGAYFTASNLPSFARLNTDFERQTTTFILEPGFDTAGTYLIQLHLHHNNVNTTEEFEITIEALVPRIDPINNVYLKEGETISVDIVADAPVPGDIFFSFDGLPDFATAGENRGDGTATLTFNPDYDAAGSYSITASLHLGDLRRDSIFELIVRDNGLPALSLMQLDETNFAATGNGIISNTDNLLQLAYLSDTLLATAIATDSFPVIYSCDNGGLSTIDIQKKTADTPVSISDIITANINDCKDADTGVLVSGLITITPSKLTPKSGYSEGYSSQVSIEDLKLYRGAAQSDRADFTGAFILDYNENSLKSELKISATTISIAGGKTSQTQEIRNLALSKTQSKESARYDIAVSGSYGSYALGGKVNFSSGENLSGYFNTYPEAGQLSATGAGDNSLLIAPNYVVNSDYLKLQLLADDKAEIALSTSAWTDLSDGHLWWNRDLGADRSAKLFDINDFLGLSNPETADEPRSIAVREKVQIQLSREIDASASASTLPATINFVPESDTLATIKANLQIKGAVLLLTPSSQLTHDSEYELPALSLLDTLGNAHTTDPITLITKDNLKAVIGSDKLSGLSGETITLNPDASYSRDSTIRKYQWKELTSLGADISSTATIKPVITLPESASEQELVIELTITDANGEKASSQITLTVLAPAVE
jgi:hypothetical protein